MYTEENICRKINFEVIPSIECYYYRYTRKPVFIDISVEYSQTIAMFCNLNSLTEITKLIMLFVAE